VAQSSNQGTAEIANSAAETDTHTEGGLSGGLEYLATDLRQHPTEVRP
jgi:hypothetical protein